MVLVYIRYINALEIILTILTNSSTYFFSIVEHLKHIHVRSTPYFYL